jgi:hypothetical protein
MNFGNGNNYHLKGIYTTFRRDVIITNLTSAFIAFKAVLAIAKPTWFKAGDLTQNLDVFPINPEVKRELIPFNKTVLLDLSGYDEYSLTFNPVDYAPSFTIWIWEYKEPKPLILPSNSVDNSTSFLDDLPLFFP